MSFAAHSWRWGNFPAGTSMLFANVAAPVGWVAQATNDRGVKIVSSVGGATGGTDAFSTCFSAAKTTDSKTLSTANMPQHAHTGPNHAHGAGTLTYSIAATGSGADTRAAGSANAETAAASVGGSTANGGTGNTGNAGSSTSFTIGLTLDLNFLAMLHCTKQ
ncbi:MAG: hypothetical protein ACYTAS_15695, partial [Planctomycetota bacterium]